MRTLKLLLLALFLPFAAQAEDIPPSPIVKTALVIHKDWAGVTFTMPKDWHIYWQNPGDSGLATMLTWTLPQGVTAGDIMWPTPEKLLTDTIVNYGYSDVVTLAAPLTFADAGAHGDVTVEARWLVCHDICIPESATLKGTLPTEDTSAAAAIQQAHDALPTPLEGSAEFSAEDKTVTLTISSMAPLRDPQFFPLDNGIMANDGKRDVKQRGNITTFTFDRGYAELPKEWHGVIRSGDKGYSITATQGVMPVASATPALPFILALAFLGGLLLNLMPCVLPILSLKALALAKKGGASHGEVRKQGITYMLGVIATFLAIAGIIISLKQAGMAAGWGFQLQQPGFVAGLVLLMVLVALNLFGAFELPVLFGNLAAGLRESTPLGSFFTGALAVALATPCTTPFMAPAIGATLTMPPAPALSVFAVLGFGMGFPFLLISFWPAALRLLPKPGAWMGRFKKWIAVPILITAAWLLWVLLHINSMPGILVTAIGTAALVLLIKVARVRALPGKALLVGILLVGAATIALQPHAVENRPADMGAIPSTPYSAAALKTLRDAGTPVFVDATAAWCITCKFNEHNALYTGAVEQYFTQHGITYMVADWTRGDASITQYLATFGRNGVPLYVYYPPYKEPVVLPQLLTPSLVTSTLDAATH